MATLHSHSTVSFKPSILSSAKLRVDAIKINNKKSLKNKLNKVGPTTEMHVILYFVSYLTRYLFARIVSIN